MDDEQPPFTITPTLAEADFRAVARGMRGRMNPVQARLVRATTALWAVLLVLTAAADAALATHGGLRPATVAVELVLFVVLPLGYEWGLRRNIDRAVRRNWEAVRGALPVHYAFSPDGFALQSASGLSVLDWSGFDRSVRIGEYLLLCYGDDRYVTVPLRDLSAAQRTLLDGWTTTKVERRSTFAR